MASAAAPLRLANQRVLVTGAGRGIGRAIALVCNKEGARVAITSRTETELEETRKLAADPDNMFCCVSDVTNTEEVEKMVETVVDTFGGLDILISNAGAGHPKGPLETLSTDDLRRLIDLNVCGVHSVTSAVLRQAMLPAQSGKIVNISSRAGKVGLPNYSLYCASKFALEGLSAALAEEVRGKGIVVNTLSPGMVDTKSFPKPEGKKGVRTAESIADCLFLLLESGANGQYIHADELDEARAAGKEDNAALKPIREPVFVP
eukprot:CAMPEP_0181022138 /NCGR_PEP_ID=MMETSP1070-20121207/1356_1 /TAXON_ID=265543 /ORGANISM="Minutocellus polymorphus, Strain NH13" /LENGTH=261 /DNA_ID=CAMNT_0023099063 /DNA_START=162 /DNA_END=947 /DNA_ORIENTATION=+